MKGYNETYLREYQGVSIYRQHPSGTYTAYLPDGAVRADTVRGIEKMIRKAVKNSKNE